jgi:hypothetical protein
LNATQQRRLGELAAIHHSSVELAIAGYAALRPDALRRLRAAAEHLAIELPEHLRPPPAPRRTVEVEPSALPTRKNTRQRRHAKAAA